MMPLSHLRKTLQSQIREGQLPEALDVLLAALPEGSETYRIVSALIFRLNSAKKERSRNTISFEEYMRLESQVSADFFDLVMGLKEEDFEEKPASAKDSGSRVGTVLYRIPHTMFEQEVAECVIRVAVDEAEIRKNLDIDEDVEIKLQVEISDVMRAEIVDLEGQTFKISSLNSANQLVKNTGYTEWKFDVTPLRLGTHKLLVKVSIMEIVPGFPEPILRDVSVMETVTVVAKPSTAAPSDAAPAEFKSNGQTFAFQSSSTAQGYQINYDIPMDNAEQAFPAPPPNRGIPPQYSPPIPSQSASQSSPNRSLRALALFLAFLVLVPAATYAIAPDLPAWVNAHYIQGTEEAYAAFIAEHPTSSRVEQAYFYRAEKSGRLADLRAYQEKYREGAKYDTRVLAKIAALETRSLESIRENPEPMKIRQFAQDFPESERLTEIKLAVETRQENRQELLAEVENAYVTSVKTQPTETKVAAYLRDFPKQGKLDEVDAAARTKPEVFQKVQPMLEEAYLKKIEQNPTPAQTGEFLDKFPEPTQHEKFEKILEKRPGLRKAVEQQKQLKDARTGAAENQLSESLKLSESSTSTIP